MKLPSRVRSSRVTRPDWAVAPGRARVLAAAATTDGQTWLLGTRTDLVAVRPSEDAVVWPWEQVQAADWDADERQLRVSLIGTYGEPRPVSTYALEEPDLLLQLLRERITASIVLQQHVQVSGKHGFRVIGRRSPVGGEIAWMCELDAGVDPQAPGLHEAMDTALRRIRSEIGH